MRRRLLRRFPRHRHAGFDSESKKKNERKQLNRREENVVLQTIDYLRKDEGAGALMVFPSWFWAKDSASFENKTQLFLGAGGGGELKHCIRGLPKAKKLARFNRKNR